MSDGATDVLILKVGGETFAAWEEVTFTRSLSSLCSVFSLSLFDEAALAGKTSVIEEQAPCEIWVGLKDAPELALTGFIDEVAQEIDRGRHGLRVTGRDKTADLIDCSAVHKAGSWKNQKLEAIAADLVKPFGLKVKAETQTGAAFAAFALEPGEKVLEALTRLSRMRGLMWKTTPNGDLVVYDPADARTRTPGFALGKDIISLRTRSSAANRFSCYVVKGQHRGGNSVSAADAASAKGEANDPTVKRHRPLIIISDEQSTKSGCQLRAEWEATSRLGNAVDAAMTVHGWRDSAGVLIAPNTIGPLQADYLGMSEDLIICDVAYSLNKSGKMASLRLVRPEAYTTEAILEARKKKGKKARHGMNYLGALSAG